MDKPDTKDIQSVSTGGHSPPVITIKDKPQKTHKKGRKRGPKKRHTTKSKATGIPGRRSCFGAATEKIIEILSSRGFTDVEMAQCLKITEQTFNNWKNKHPKFFESLKDWKKQSDQNVERSLYERAKGYKHPETKAQWVQDQNGGRWETIDLERHYPPDPTSMIFWLKNRQPEKWRDKQDVEHSGNIIIDAPQIEKKW